MSDLKTPTTCSMSASDLCLLTLRSTLPLAWKAVQILLIILLWSAWRRCPKTLRSDIEELKWTLQSSVEYFSEETCTLFELSWVYKSAKRHLLLHWFLYATLLLNELLKVSLPTRHVVVVGGTKKAQQKTHAWLKVRAGLFDLPLWLSSCGPKMEITNSLEWFQKAVLRLICSGWRRSPNIRNEEEIPAAKEGPLASITT